jgi:hydrogenase-4 component E
MDKYLNLLSMLILVSTFLLVSNKRINSYIQTYTMQSVLLATLLGIIGFYKLVNEGSWEMIVIFLITIAIKVIYLPHLLKITVEKVRYTLDKDILLSIPTSILICCALVMLTYFSVSSINDIPNGNIKIFFVNSISVVLIGLFFMISRKKAIGQIIGFMVIENGIFTTAVLAIHGMPMIIELGIFVDLLIAILIMGILVFKINKNFDSININKLKKLRG